MADDYGLSVQDKSDLAEIRKRLPANDPRRAKIDTLIGPEMVAAPSTSTPTPPNSIVGGIGRHVVDTLRGLKSTFAPPQSPIEALAGPGLPVFRMAKGAVESGITAGKQAVTQAKAAAAIPPGNKTIKALEYARALNTGLSALDPFASSTVANVNELQDEGRTREAVGEAIPDTALLVLGTKPGQAVARALTPDIPGFVKGKIGKITKTTPEHVGTFVAKTAEENAAKSAAAETTNAAERAKAEKANSENAAERKVDLRKHFEKTSATKAANEASESASSRKSALERGVKERDEPIRADLTRTRDTVKAEADRRYSNQRAELSKKQIPFNGADAENPEAITSANIVNKITDAWDSTITGSETRPPIIKSIAERLNSTEPLTWKDLQGYRSEIGKKLSSETLPGDEFYGYRKALNIIDEGMQKIADANGMGKQVAADRAFYRQYIDTFRDPSSPIYKAIHATERGGTAKALAAADRSGIEAIARYNPELARRAHQLREAHVESRKITPGRLKSLPKLAPKPPAVEPKLTQPDLKVITPETVHQFKADQILGKGENLENTSNRMATIFTGLDAIRNIFKRNPQGIAIDLAARGSFGAVQNAIGKLLENPKFVNALSNLTPADIDQIMRLPADQRAGFDQIVQQARKQGVKVDPAVVSALAAATPRQKPVAAALAGAR